MPTLSPRPKHGPEADVGEGPRGGRDSGPAPAPQPRPKLPQDGGRDQGSPGVPALPLHPSPGLLNSYLHLLNHLRHLHLGLPFDRAPVDTRDLVTRSHRAVPGCGGVVKHLQGGQGEDLVRPGHSTVPKVHTQGRAARTSTFSTAPLVGLFSQPRCLQVVAPGNWPHSADQGCLSEGPQKPPLPGDPFTVSLLTGCMELGVASKGQMHEIAKSL